MRDISLEIAEGEFLTILGESGSGKTTVVKKILYPALKKILGGYGEATGSYDRLDGNYNDVTATELVDQNPIGKSSRSNQ